VEHEALARVVERQRRLLVIIWGSMMTTLVIYLLIPPLVAPEGLIASGAVFVLLRPFFWLVAVVEVLFLNWWKQDYLKPRTLLSDLSAPEQVNAAVSNTTTRGIVAFALAESIALYGLVLALIGKHFLDQYLLTFVSGILMIQLYPSRQLFDELVREAQVREPRA
jgi:hypothetical protein